jgi:PmbA protein
MVQIKFPPRELSQKLNEQFDAEELCLIAEEAVKYAQSLGADQSEILINNIQSLSVASRNCVVESVENQLTKTMDFYVYKNHRRGSAVTTDLSKESVKKSVEKALQIAKYTGQDRFVGIADRESLAFDYPDLDLYYHWEIFDVKNATDMAKECEEAARSFDRRITNIAHTSITSSENLNVYANSHGFLGFFPTSAYGITCAPIASANDQMQREHYYTIHCDPNFIESPSLVGKKSAELALRKLGARTIKTQICPVIFYHDVAATLLENFISAISGHNLEQKTSFLLGKLGQKVFSERFTIGEKPLLKKCIGSTPFDNEGVRVFEHNIVTNGVLNGYVLNSYFARKLKMQTTGNGGGVHNLFISPAEYDFPGLLKLMNRGLLVTSLLGHGTNITNGTYSRGAFGYWVENGEIQYPVEGITIASNLQELFLSLIAAGTDVDRRTAIHTGSLLFPQMTVAGI